MKTINLTFLICLLIVLNACNNKKNKNNDTVVSEIDKPTTEKPIIKDEAQNEQENLLPLEVVVKEMLTTSPRYIKLTKGLKERVTENKGFYFGLNLERSPDRSKGTEGNYSKTYDFTIYEMYEEKQLSTSRFSFSPDKKQLYEYDILNDSLVPIEFDQTLLHRFDSLNKLQ